MFTSTGNHLRLSFQPHIYKSWIHPRGQVTVTINSDFETQGSMYVFPCRDFASLSLVVTES